MGRSALYPRHLAVATLAATVALACSDGRRTTAPDDAAAEAAVAGIAAQPTLVLFTDTGAVQWKAPTRSDIGGFHRISGAPRALAPAPHGREKYRVVHGSRANGTSDDVIFVEDENGKPPKRIFHFSNGKPTIAFLPVYSKSGGDWHVIGGRELFFDGNGRERAELRFSTETPATPTRVDDCDDEDAGPCGPVIKMALRDSAEALAKTGIVAGLTSQCLEGNLIACTALPNAIAAASAAAGKAAGSDYLAYVCSKKCKNDEMYSTGGGTNTSSSTNTSTSTSTSTGGYWDCITWYEGYYDLSGDFVATRGGLRI